MASNSLPSCSICSGLSFASGLSMVVSVTRAPSLEVDFDGAFRRADADADHLPLGAVDISVSQVSHLARAQLAGARVADALAAAVGQVEAALLAGHQDRRAAVGFGLGVAGLEADLASLALLGETDLGL